MKQNNWCLDKVIVVVLATITLLLINVVNSNHCDIPILKIELNDITLSEINIGTKDIKYAGNYIEVEDINGDKISENITIKGRGNNTWTWPKKPYQIIFDKNVNLFNLGKSKKWVLLANFVDETLIRNDMSFYIGRMLELDYTFDGKNIDLYVDGEYQGVYYLTHKVEISEGSVNLKNDDAVVVELDNVYYYREDNYQLSKYSNDHLVLKDVKNKKYKETAFNNFMDKYNKLEKAIADDDWKTISELIDVESFSKYYIINRIAMNGDAYRSSFFMYMDGKDDKIHAGPIWDFDMAYMNKVDKKLENVNIDYNYEKVEKKDTINMNEDSKLIDNLLHIKEFKIITNNIWKDKIGNQLENLKIVIDNKYEILKNSATKNITKWNYPNTYNNYIEELKNNLEFGFEVVEGYLGL